MKRDQEAKDEYEAVLFELLQNEQEEKAREEARQEMEKRIRDRIEMQRHHALQMEIKEQKLIALAEEEDAYRR